MRHSAQTAVASAGELSAPHRRIGRHRQTGAETMVVSGLQSQGSGKGQFKSFNVQPRTSWFLGAQPINRFFPLFLSTQKEGRRRQPAVNESSKA